MTALELQRLACGLAALVAVALMVLPARGDLAIVEAEKNRRRKALLEGTHVFRRILHDRGMTAIDAPSDPLVVAHPEKCILIVLGNLEELRNLPKPLSKFVNDGGALLAASDRPLRPGAAARELLKVAGVSIKEETVVCKDPSACYRELGFCPYLIPVEKGRPDLFKELPNNVATNVPSFLIRRSDGIRGIHELATLPPRSVVAPPQEFRLGVEIGGTIVPIDPSGSMLDEEKPEKPLLFAVGGAVGKGRVLVLADHSLFINEMMLPTDTGNVEFTYNCIDWLSDEKRKHVLFIEDGRVQTKFDIPMRSARIPTEELLELLIANRNEVLAEAEKGVVQLEQEDFFNRALLDLLDDYDLTPSRLLRYLALLGTALLLVYALVRLGIRQRFRHETSVPLLAAEVSRTLPAGPLVEQRTEELLRQRNLAEPASVLVRHWFARLGVEAPPGKQPAFAVRGGWWNRWRLGKQLHRLWLLANGRQGKRVSSPEVWRLQRDLEALRARWERGEWSAARPTA